MPELAVIIVVALVVLGPKRLPEVARSLGKGLAEFRRLTGDVNKELDAARHMIESEAREHERIRRDTAREARESLRGASTPQDADDAAEDAAPDPEPDGPQAAAPAPAPDDGASTAAGDRKNS